MSDTILNLALDVSKGALKKIINDRENELSLCCEFNNFTEEQCAEYDKKTQMYKDCLIALDNASFIDKSDYLTLAADFDNYKKRMSKEKSDIIHLANKDIIEDLLKIVDDMERLLNVSTDVKTNEGFKLIYDNMLKLLENEGCEKIECKIGDKFDVNIHEAIAIQPISVSQNADNVVNIYQSGWMLNGKLLRPVKVIVGK